LEGCDSGESPTANNAVRKFTYIGEEHLVVAEGKLVSIANQKLMRSDCTDVAIGIICVQRVLKVFGSKDTDVLIFGVEGEA